jgi:hypothetical protein
MGITRAHDGVEVYEEGEEEERTDEVGVDVDCAELDRRSLDEGGKEGVPDSLWK